MCAGQLLGSSLVTYQTQGKWVKREVEATAEQVWILFWSSCPDPLGVSSEVMRNLLLAVLHRVRQTPSGFGSRRLLLPKPCSEILFQIHRGPPSITMAKISLVASQMFRWFPVQIINPTLSPGTDPILLKPQLAFGGNLTPAH